MVYQFVVIVSVVVGVLALVALAVMHGLLWYMRWSERRALRENMRLAQVRLTHQLEHELGAILQQLSARQVTPDPDQIDMFTTARNARPPH